MKGPIPDPDPTVPARRGAVGRRAGAGATNARIDADLRHLDRLAGVGRLAAEAAHEVRNALTAVKTLVQLLPTRADDPELRGPFLALAAEELGRIERLLDALLAQARGEPRRADPASVEPGAALHDVAQLLARRASDRDVHLAVDVGPALPAAAIGADALRQVLLNLALNAVESTPPGGDVRLSAERVGPAIEVAVEDRGPGVPVALRQRIFEPWFSTREDRPGGLGLAIARQLVDEAGGALTVGDRPGGGARLCVRIPARPAAR